MDCPAFLNEKCFKRHLTNLIDTTKEEAKFDFSAIDPFSMLFKMFLGKTTFEGYLKNEKIRQDEKALQNKVGEFQQNIITCIKGWERIDVVDVKNDKSKIICEVKNKYNTMNAGGRVEVYDRLNHLLNSEYKGYKGFLVEIISKNKREYNDVYTPSDSKIKTHKPKNEKIRVIDGKSFYYMITKNENALKEIYDYIPVALTEIYGLSFKEFSKSKKELDKMFYEVFK